MNIEDIEAIRLKQLEERNKYRKILIPILITTFIINFVIGKGVNNTVYIISLIILCISIYIAVKKFDKLFQTTINFSKAEYKDIFEGIIKSNFGSSTTFEPEKGFNDEEIEATKILNPEKFIMTSNKHDYTIKHSNKITGKTGLNKFELAKVEFVMNNLNIKTSWGYILVLKASYPYSFEGQTRIEKTMPFTGIVGGSVVNLEGTEFNKQFHVTTNDQIGARLILQTDTMQTMLNLKRRYTYTDYYFTDNTMWLKIYPVRSWLELSLDKPLAESIMTVEHIVREIIGIMNQLELHHVGTKY
jgi:Protein of unknown function (DUF3137)